jgi:membrane protein implicated in regulation of membrane protease activity
MITSILPVWQDLSLLEQIYWTVTVPSTLIFVIILIMTIFGADVGGDVETDIDAELADGDSIPFQFLSLKNIIAFFTMFGWSGLGFLHAGLAVWLVIFLSAVCGFLMMVAMAALFYFMSKLAETGTLKMKNAIGRSGEVYLTIPAKREGMGKVQLTVQGTLRTLDAVTDEPEPIVTSSIVEVADVIADQILLVKRPVG